MKYPPYSWLRLNEEIKQAPGRIWFSFNKLPERQGECLIKVHIGSSQTSLSDPYDAINNSNIILPRQQKVLDILLKEAKPTRNKCEFQLNHASFSKLLPFCGAIPFEINNIGIITQSKQHAYIKAFLNKEKNVLEFYLVKASLEKINNPQFFGEINAYVIDEDAKVYLISPPITPNEAKSIVSSGELPLLGLCQQESRQIFYALSRLGIDFTCLNEIAKDPQSCQIYLRIILSIDDLNKKMCARAHLVTEINNYDFKDEVEIKSTGSIPSTHIAVDHNLNQEKYVEEIELPTLIRRPYNNEHNARQFLYHLGAGPARLHDGFEFKGESAFELIKNISNPSLLPSYIKLDDSTKPNIIELEKKPYLILREFESTSNRVEVAISLGKDFDEKDINFSSFKKAKDNILVVDEDTLVILNEDIITSVNYFTQAFNIEKPNLYKDKPIAQVALIINALKDYMEVKASPKLTEIITKFSLEIDENDKKLPSDLQATLRPYQHDAVAWLSSLFRSGLGGLLGDEMGLGKTLMVLTHLAKLKEEKLIDKPALVVCPTSVIDVWAQEAQKHIPTLKVQKWHGAERHNQEKFENFDILITSYAILRRDIDTKLAEIKFSTLILDEAQYIRNQQTDSFKSAKSLNCIHRLALTGTPIENHIGDLFNILDCVEDGILGSRTAFEKQFANPSDSNQNKNILNLKMLLSPIVTRRKKAEVESELPPKIENIIHCKLSSEQKDLYRQYVGELSSSLNQGLLSDKDQRHTHFTLLSALTRLRQICCHPSLVTNNDYSIEKSGKLLALKEIMSECLEMDRKMIIYSQFLKMQEHIVNISKELSPQGALWLHGSTKNRDEIVRNFQDKDGPKIIVVSLKAGGTGITLTQADTVIFADPWWNPAVEDQAIDRAHRIGQKKTVHVIRLIAEDSIECEVIALAQKKRVAAQSILHESFKNASSLSKDEIKALLLHEIDRFKN